jgi:hypothetical protein
LTLDTYGKWFAMKLVRGGVNILGAVVSANLEQVTRQAD